MIMTTLVSLYLTTTYSGACEEEINNKKVMMILMVK